MNADRVIDDILRREGGYVDHPADRGGPTKYGITQATLAAWRGRAVTAVDVQALTQDEAREIYAEEYIRKPGFDRVNGERLSAFLVDSAVNHGPATAAKFLQRALGVSADGVIGPATRSALYNSDPVRIFHRALAERAKFYGRLITDDPSQAPFAAGWMNRLAEFIAS